MNFVPQIISMEASYNGVLLPIATYSPSRKHHYEHFTLIVHLHNTVCRNYTDHLLSLSTREGYSSRCVCCWTTRWQTFSVLQRKPGNNRYYSYCVLLHLQGACVCIRATQYIRLSSGVPFIIIMRWPDNNNHCGQGHSLGKGKCEPKRNT